MAPPAAHDLPADLTPQELRIAEPAAEGLTNRDIGTRLYLSHRSHRTIGFHLHKIFPKLGITGRANCATSSTASGGRSDDRCRAAEAAFRTLVEGSAYRCAV